MKFITTEFEANRNYQQFQRDIKKILERKFTNADSIRNLEDNNQLALKLWNLPKFESFDQLKEWLDKEYVYQKCE